MEQLNVWVFQTLSYHGQRLCIPVTIIFPFQTLLSVIEKCQDFNATVVLHGKDLAESKRKAFILISEGANCTYVNG